MLGALRQNCLRVSGLGFGVEGLGFRVALQDRAAVEGVIPAQGHCSRASEPCSRPFAPLKEIAVGPSTGAVFRV